ncbi:MAG: DNA-processing protein DprA [Neomegalonema sp.]|nr:DNA-processing protein DprA [Neomegalonema sp.]
MNAPPPFSQDEFDWVRLARSPQVGPTTFRRLIRRFGSAGKALEALPELARRGGSARRLAPAALDRIEAELKAATAQGARLLRLDEPGYARGLAEIYDPPPALWALGDTTFQPDKMVAIVGSRTATANGARFAEWIARDLAEAGWTIVSGLARGIDAAAHRGSLAAAGSRAIAVVAGGVDHIYPPENAALREQIIERGLVLLEMPMGLAPLPKHFPRRNRIVSGLSQGVAVIEAAEKSGSLITARCALEQNREVMAAPGHPLDARSAGGNALIREGAVLIRNAEDVIAALSASYRIGAHAPAQGALFDSGSTLDDAPEDLAERLFALLGAEAAPFDILVRQLAAPAGHVAAAVMELEIAERAQSHPGGGVSRVVGG